MQLEVIFYCNLYVMKQPEVHSDGPFELIPQLNKDVDIYSD